MQRITEIICVSYIIFNLEFTLNFRTQHFGSCFLSAHPYEPNLSITYNVLNLQQSLSQSGTAVANYSWLADGTKCAVVDNTTNGYDYLGSLIYTRNGSTRTLESTDFGGGRIVYSGSTYSLYYYITDHLGSIRTIVDNSGTVREQNDYYPFGGRHANGSIILPANKQKFNGKELQTTGNTGFLDYGARMYDDVIGRWSVVDPMAEKYAKFTPYSYVANRPISFIDPDGMDQVSYNKDDFSSNRLSTNYVDQNGRTILETNDGRDDVYMVPPHLMNVFRNHIQYCNSSNASDYNSIGWNDYWRSQFILVIPGNVLNSFHSTAARKAYIEYYFSGDLSDWTRFLFYEVGGQWCDPELVVMGMSFGLNGLNSITRAASMGTIESKWVYGAFKSEAKWVSQFSKRGWTPALVTEAITNGKSFNAVNMINKTNPAIRYIHPTTGQSIVKDKVTNELLHIGGPGFKY